MKTTLLSVILSLLTFTMAYSQSSQKIYNKLISVKEKILVGDTKSKKSLDSLKPILEKADVDSLWGLYYRTLATSLSMQMEKEKALENLDLSISYYQKASNPKGVSLSMLNKGGIYLYQGKTKQSLSTFLKSLEIAKKNNLAYVCGQLYQNIGVLYFENGKIDEARDYAIKAYNIFKGLNKEKDMAGMLSNIGNTYYEKYDDDKALEYFNKALVISEKLKDSITVAQLFNNIGAVYIDDKKDLKKGLSYLIKSLEIRRKLNDQNGMILQYNNIAKCLADAGDMNTSESYLEKAFSLADKSGNQSGIRDVYGTYSTIYEKKGDYKNSLKYYKLYRGIKDSLLNKENVQILNDFKIKYETAEKDSEISNQKSKILKRNILLLALFGLLLLGLIYYKYYSNKQKINLQKEIINQQDLAARAVMKAEDNERKRMALHLHDGIGTLLSAINMNIDVLENLKDEDAQFLKVLTKTKSMLDDAITDVRDLSHQMIPNMLIKNSLSNALRDLIEKTNSPKLQIVLDMEGLIDDIEQNIQVVIYRIIQESINNVIKHAEAKSVKITIFQNDTVIKINVIDDGKGFDHLEKNRKGNGLGLENIKSRIDYLKGDVKIESIPEKGTSIKVQIPLV